MTASDTGSVLGASTAVGLGATMLPNTSGNSLFQVLTIAVIAAGTLVIAAVIAKMIIKQYVTAK